MADTADALLAAATKLFAERGFEGTSVRAICEAADANLNAVSYHFGGKRGLYEKIVARFGDVQVESARRVLGEPPRDERELETRLLLYVEEMLAAYREQPELLIILFAEFQQAFRNSSSDVLGQFREQTEVLLRFLRGARRRGLLRKGIDVEIVAGALMERITNQVRYADSIAAIYGESTSAKSPTYLRHWARQTVQLLLYGAAR